MSKRRRESKASRRRSSALGRGQRFRIEPLEPRAMLSADAVGGWQNSLWPSDVDADGVLAPLDAMLIINELDAHGARQFVGGAPATAAALFDVDGDQYLSPLDALRVINALDRPTPLLTSDTSPGFPVATLRIDDAVLASEGDSGSQWLEFNVHLDKVLTQTVTIEFNVGEASGNATQGMDYRGGTAVVTFAPGQLEQSIRVLVFGDTLKEPNEYFLIGASKITPGISIVAGVRQQLAQFSDYSPLAVGVIPNDDHPQEFSIARAGYGTTEGTGTIVFDVTLAYDETTAVTVAYATTDGTAQAGSDYVATSGTLTFAPGVRKQSVTVPIIADSIPERHEWFFLDLSNPSDSIALGRSRSDADIARDNAPELAIVDGRRIIELESGNVVTEIAVEITPAPTAPVTVKYATESGTAQAHSDFVPVGGTLTFLPDGPMRQTVTVEIIGDTVDEGNEEFSLTLSDPVGAFVGSVITSPAQTTSTNVLQPNEAGLPLRYRPGDAAPGQIIIDDQRDAPAYIWVYVGPTTEAAGSAMVQFDLSHEFPQEVMVSYETTTGSAASGVDFQAMSGVVTFLPGSVTQTVTIPIYSDAQGDAGEMFTIRLRDSVNATIERSEATCTIDPLTVSIDEVNVNEGESAAIPVTISSAPGVEMTVEYSTVTADNGSAPDFTPASGTLTFGPGRPTTQYIMVPTTADALDEANEWFDIRLTNAAGGTIAKREERITISDDDDDGRLPAVWIDSMIVGVSQGGERLIQPAIHLSAPSNRPVTVSYRTMDGTGRAGTDYLAASGTVTFAPGETSKRLVIIVKRPESDEGNTIDEPLTDELLIELCGAQNASIQGGLGAIDIGGYISDQPSFVILFPGMQPSETRRDGRVYYPIIFQGYG